MSKPAPPKYKTTNWKAYNAALKARGSLMIWLDRDMSWYGSPLGKRGRTQTFSDAAIRNGAKPAQVGGAGLANALFCRAGAQMLELLPSPDVAPGTFHSVASAAGMSYWVLHGNRRDASAVPDIHANFVIDPELFERALSRVLGSP